MFYVVNISFFFLAAGSRYPEKLLSLAAGSRELGTHRLWQPETGVREALIYFLENHCTTSGKIEL